MPSFDGSSTNEQARRAFLIQTGKAAATLGLFGAQSAMADVLSSSTSTDPNGLLQHRFGVNYVPSKSWYFIYNAWDRASIADDLSRIAEIGADHIRVMVIWPWFQPNPVAISEPHLDRLDDLIQLAASRNLDVFPSLFTGWLSGYHFNPFFYEKEPFYTSSKWEAAQTLYVNSLAKRMRAHKNFSGFDLGNEMACSWKAPVNEGDSWMMRRFAQINEILPDKIHVNGVDHQSWFHDDTFSAKSLVEQQKMVALHCWPYWTGAAERGGPFDKPYTHLIAGMATLARSIGSASNKPIWAQEFGACALEMPAEDLPRYMETAIEAGIESGVSWFTWWASHDVSRQFEFHPFEYSLGLIDCDNKIKPQGRKFREIADRYRGKTVSIPSRPLPMAPVKRTDTDTWDWLSSWMETVSA